MQQSKLGKFQALYENSEEFRLLKQEIWTQGQYYWDEMLDEENDDFKPNQPLILDLGAHIGIATLYFAGLFPAAKIFAFEPNPENFAILQQNIELNCLEDRVQARQIAAGVKNMTLPFYLDQEENPERNWSMSASFLEGSWNGGQAGQQTQILVPVQPLSQILVEVFETLAEESGDFSPMRQIDLLKMDIEGWESDVLRAARAWLPRIKRIILEYHPTGKQSLAGLAKFLDENGFKLEFFMAEGGQEHEFDWRKKPNEPKELLLVRAVQKKLVLG